MLITYPQIKEKAFYDVCDIDGKILLTGYLSHKTNSTEVSLSEIAKGRYVLFIVNEGEIFKQAINYA